MSNKDTNDKQKKVLYENLKIASAVRASKAVNEKPTKSAAEHFRRKPYQKKGEKNG